MRSTVEPLEGNKVKLSVEVDASEFEPAVDAAFKKIAREVRLPGFRPGKAPRKVLEARYLKKNEAGECIEGAGSLFRRVGRTMAAVEGLYGASETERRHWEDRFYNLMTSGAFMPNSPTLMNAGRELGMLSACFVLPVHDSINDIFDAIKHTAMIQKAGGGIKCVTQEIRP